MLQLKSKPQVDTAQPTLRSVSPEFAEIDDKLRALNKREAELLAEVQPLNEKASNVGAFHWVYNLAQPPASPPVPIEPSSAAKSLLGRLSPPPRLPEPRKSTSHPMLAKIRELAAELDAVREAIEILGPLHAKAHRAASRALCEQVMPDYQAIASRVCSALVDLGNAQIEHDEFTRSLEARGAVWSWLLPIQDPSLGDPRDSGSEIRRLLSWAAEGGHFDIRKIPENWRER